MENPAEQAPDLADLIRRIMDEHDISQSGIAAKTGISVSTINAWLNGKRGKGRGPKADNLRALAEAFRIPVRDVFAAAGRKVPGPIAPAKNAELLALFGRLTAEQQNVLETTARVMDQQNRTES